MTWTDNRETALQGIMADLVILREQGTIVTLDRNPAGKIGIEQMDAVLLFEGPDYIDRNVSSSPLGPQQRTLNLIIELWCYNDSDDITALTLQLRSLYNEVRKRAIGKRGLFEKSLTRVHASAVPGVLGIGIVLDLKYINNGN